MRTAIIVFGGLAIIMIGSVGAVEVAFQDAALGSQESIEVNDSFTPDHDTTHEFDDSNGDGYVYVSSDDVTVTQGGDSIDAAEGENWEWNRADGTLYVPDGSDLNESDDATIEFEYAEATDEQQLNRDLGLVAPQSGGVLVEVGGAVMLLASIVILARMGGK